MKEKINQINQSIAEKRDRLKEKVEWYFDSIIIPSGTFLRQQDGANKKESTFLSKIKDFVRSMHSKFGSSKSSVSTTNSDLNISSIKNEIISKIIDSVKKTSNEWESFMELKQKEVQSVIASSSLSESQKDELISKICLYEVIDINIFEFSSMVGSANTSSDVEQCIGSYKSRLFAAIDTASGKQIVKYNSLVL